ncbi:MAG: acyl-CoA dehydrogenase family protein [Acidimicrobiales bacterium]|jgi:alkylation response protein AidB-like acyl-CoA dehydrogenase
MEFRLSDDQFELQDAVRKFCVATRPIGGVAERVGGLGDRSSWRALSDLGVFGLLVPVDQGGSGLGCVEATVVFEQLGAHLVEGPVVWSTITAPLVTGAVDGSRVVAGLELDLRSADSLVVEHGAEADTVVVLHQGGAFAHERNELPDPVALDPLDPLTPVTRFSRLPEGSQIGDGGTSHHLRLLGTALSAALLLGIAGQSLEVARDYALTREQFNVPIGSFQALKHLMADMFVRVELARSATYAAASVIDNPRVGDPERAGRIAKLLAGEAALANSRAAVQILGGMGFTWAMPPHFLLKRCWVLENSFGTTEDHARALGAGLEHVVT